MMAWLFGSNKFASDFWATVIIMGSICSAVWLFWPGKDTPSRWSRFVSFLMSRYVVVPTPRPVAGEQRSDAVERSTEPSGTEDGNVVPDLVEQLSALDDDALLDILARIHDADGEYRFAESRVAKFIPGRVEERLDQVRKVRHTEKPPAPGRVLRVHDQAGERVIPFL
jgi:hypothetical protein